MSTSPFGASRCPFPGIAERGDTIVTPATAADLASIVDIHIRAEQSRFPTEVEPGLPLPTFAEIRSFHDRTNLAGRTRLINERAIACQEGKHVRVARIGETIVGFSKYDSADNYLDALYVVPEAQGQQIGSLLLRGCLDMAGSKPTRLITSLHTPSVVFYERHGFTIAGAVEAERCPQVTATKRLPLINMVYAPNRPR